MSLTFLIDLDDTLISNNMETFIPAYLKALGSHLANYVEPELFISTLLTSTEKMLKNDQPNVTLRNKLESEFDAKLGFNFQDIRQPIEDFYTNHFPSLKNLIEPRPEAIKLINQAFNRGYQLVIATNPVFPQTAIRQRMDWGNLSPENYDFSLISCYETFHFAKPNPAFYAEVLAQIGWPEMSTLMVGNDKQADIDPARELGLAVFWISQNNGYAQQPRNEKSPLGIGWLDDLLNWIDTQPPEQLQPQFDTPTALLSVLKSTPAAFDTFTNNMRENFWQEKTNPGEWSMGEITCHLRDVDKEINIPRIRTILEDTNPFIESINAEPWSEERAYQSQDGAAAFQEFVNYRLELLDMLSSISENDWQRDARHTIFGPTTLIELVKIFTRHDRLHIQQTKKTLDKIKRIKF
jgi:FMN phosphatase YigB (HAD superfamily)